MSNLRELLTNTADRVADYRGSLAERRVAPISDLERLRAELGRPLPTEGADAEGANNKEHDHYAQETLMETIAHLIEDIAPTLFRA